MSGESRNTTVEENNGLAYAGSTKEEEFVPRYHKRTIPDWIKLH